MDLENKRDDGALYLFEPTRGTLARKLDGFRTINGLAWDPSRRRLYLSDSHPEVQTVWTCPVNSESAPGETAVFARFHDLDGRPDGAALDGCRNYWIAGVGGGAIYRFLPDGDMLCWSVPVQSPTKPAFVPGHDGTAMVLTSRRDTAQGGRLAIWQDPPGVG
jgi:sugar lactone lactonase YvrE